MSAVAMPNTKAIAITLDVAFSPSEVFVGVGGNVNATPVGGSAVLFKNIPSGGKLPVLCTMINTATTTATDMVACRP